MFILFEKIREITIGCGDKCICNRSYVLGNFIPLNVFLFLSLLLTIFFAILFISSFKKTLLNNVSFVLILLGGITNLIERFIYGCVHDYIKFFGFFYYNISDFIVILGIVGFLVQLAWESKYEKYEEHEN